jgi:hypothetical protein
MGTMFTAYGQIKERNDILGEDLSYYNEYSLEVFLYIYYYGVIPNNIRIGETELKNPTQEELVRYYIENGVKKEDIDEAIDIGIEKVAEIEKKNIAPEEFSVIQDFMSDDTKEKVRAEMTSGYYWEYIEAYKKYGTKEEVEFIEKILNKN